LKKDYPEKDWYWPIYHSSTDGIDCADYIANDEEPETKRPKNVSVPTKTSPVSSETFIYYNGHNAPEEIDYRQLSLDQLNSMYVFD
jgi:hypothetical protein